MRHTSRHLIALALALILLAGCAPSKTTLAPAEENGRMTISFDYAKQSGYAANQFAVWVEDANGALIKTLYATRFTVKGGYQEINERAARMTDFKIQGHKIEFFGLCSTCRAQQS